MAPSGKHTTYYFSRDLKRTRQFFKEHFWMINLTSLVVKGLSGRESGSGKLRYIWIMFVLSGTFMSVWGWNMLWRWLSNNSAFLVSDEVKLPPNFILRVLRPS